MIETKLIWWSFWMVVAFWLTKSIIPVLIMAAEKYNLYDDPDNNRKIHNSSVPTLGGVAIFISFLIGFSFMVAYASNGAPTHFDGYGFFIAAVIILFGVGVKDDIIGLTVTKKLGAQIAACVIIILGAGLSVSSMGGLFGVEGLSPAVAFGLTLFTMIVITNSYNLIDGIDGLAGSVALVASVFFGYWFWQAGLFHWASFSSILAASLAGFLWYNVSPARIFMGDTGSLIVGFFLAMQAVAFVYFGTTLESVVSWQHAVPVLAMAALVIPLYDTLRVFMIRIAKRSSPFRPDRSHLHHFLLDIGCNHREAAAILTLVNIFFVGLAVLLADFMGNTALLLTLIGTAMVLFPTYGLKSYFLRPMLDGTRLFKTFQDSLSRQTSREPSIPQELLDQLQSSSAADQPTEVDFSHAKKQSEEERKSELA